LSSDEFQVELGPISKLVRFFCPDVEVSELANEEFCWYLLSDWDTQINKRSSAQSHPWLIKLNSTPGGFIRWGRSTTRSGNAPEKLIHKPHTHFGCNINETGWVQVSEPEVRGAHLLSRATGECAEINSDWLLSFEMCRKQLYKESTQELLKNE
jgi:hypothetical protein